LGGATGFAALRRALKANGIGIIVDVVPNHMAIAVRERLNAAVWSILREGRRSPFATWFDIDWDAEGGRILMPVLDGPIEKNVDKLVLGQHGRAFELRYLDHRFPVAPGTGKLPMPEFLEAQHYRLADWR